ncbi:hypothetical protein V500_10906 [Pseudogymnoascus sp. VKM F-4518 (FW-2643)]|nr:hypothetical protein V500_10906 [Pseudogymnoascus sp. VKM F-4518 (FW-2643)]
MSERKVLQKYYPPDFDPSKITRSRAPKQAGPKVQTVRLMAPFSMKCIACGEYIYKGRKFNARKETTEEKYLSITIFRFYIRCTRCSAEITFKTDPKSLDYTCERGAKRNFEPWRQGSLKEETEEERLDRLEAEEAEKDTMEELEAKTLDAKTEMAVADALDEIRTRNARFERVGGGEASSVAAKPEADESAVAQERADEEAAKRAFQARAKEAAGSIVEEDTAVPEKTVLPTFTRTVKKKKDHGALLGIKKKPKLKREVAFCLDNRNTQELALDGPSKYWSEAPTSRRRKATLAGSPDPGEESNGKKPPAMASQRKRVERGRGGGNGHDGNAEQSIWEGCQDTIKSMLTLVTRMEECKKEILLMEAALKERETLGSVSPTTARSPAPRSYVPPDPPSVLELDALSSLQREQVKLSEQILSAGRTGDTPLIERLKVLRGLQSHNEGATAEPSRRGGPSREKSSMDLDIASESPAPPADKPSRKNRDLGGGSSRGSQPPKEGGASAKDTPQPPPSFEIDAKGKITFNLNAEVAFRPKHADSNFETEWIQGVVVKIIGEGKSRRYDVQDPEPDEVTNRPGAIHKTSAARMVPIPELGKSLPDYPQGKAVLARYPDTTTFYRAEVVAMNGKLVKLRFEGEEDEQVTMEVDRRFVLDHRGDHKG